MMKIAIVGSGLSGLACADRLVAAGHSVRLFDKARGPGGRMSTRRVDTAVGQVSFDHGAQYFTARDPAFRQQVGQWEDSGAAARWPAAGSEAWVGVPTMNAPVKALAASHDVAWSSRIDALARQDNGWHLQCGGTPVDGPFDALVLAIPAEQAAILLAPWHPDFQTIAAQTVSAPCWTAMLAFETPLPTDTITLRDDAVIGWAARNADKPGRGGPDAWVIQASPSWSLTHLEEGQDQVLAALTARFTDILNISLPDPLVATAHRWRYARSGQADHKALYSEEKRLGVCGDWLIGPRVECAWLSGVALAGMILA